MNITNPEHAYALAAAVNGHLRLGSLTQLIPEANDAGRVGAMVLDGLSGDDKFPFGDMKALYTVGEVNMCEENHGEVVSNSWLLHPQHHHLDFFVEKFIFSNAVTLFQSFSMLVFQMEWEPIWLMMILFVS